MRYSITPEEDEENSQGDDYQPNSQSREDEVTQAAHAHCRASNAVVTPVLEDELQIFTPKVERTGLAHVFPFLKDSEPEEEVHLNIAMIIGQSIESYPCLPNQDVPTFAHSINSPENDQALHKNFQYMPEAAKYDRLEDYAAPSGFHLLKGFAPSLHSKHATAESSANLPHSPVNATYPAKNEVPILTKTQKRRKERRMAKALEANKEQNNV